VYRAAKQGSKLIIRETQADFTHGHANDGAAASAMRTPSFLAVLFLLLLVNLQAQSIYDIPVKDIDGKSGTLAPYKGRVLLIVNVASECGYTPQYQGLEALYRKFSAQGLTVIGVPCNQFGGQEPGTNKEIKEFCSSTFHVTFPLLDKTDVNGRNRHALYAALAGKDSPVAGDIQWNFSKFLIGRDGKILKRYGSDTEPESPEVTKAIEAALAAK
jgi:glutathione peroxidase